jgi:hypothetical protein
MNSLNSELQQARLLPLVLKVGISHDLTTVVVEVQDTTSLKKVRHKNTLYFEADSFSVAQVERAIEHILSGHKNG